ELEPTGEGLYDRMSGIGAHELIVESPDHTASLATLPDTHLAAVLGAWRDRMIDLQKDKRFEYVSVFKNHGEAAGAYLEHPHSQLIATPMVPLAVEGELEGALRHFRIKKRCIWCDIIRQEMHAKVRGLGRLILGEGGFVALSPYAPRFPFETWVLPESHRSSYEEMGGGELLALARVLGDVIRRMDRVLSDPAWNLTLHSAPLKTPALDHFHWHVEIAPNLPRMAGFEWGGRRSANALCGGSSPLAASKRGRRGQQGPGWRKWERQGREIPLALPRRGGSMRCLGISSAVNSCAGVDGRTRPRRGRQGSR